MRILYLAFDDLSLPYAWTVHVRAVVNGLIARGHDLRLVAPGGRALGIGAPCDPLPPGRWNHMWGSLGVFVRSGRDFGPDVVYVRGLHLSVTPALAAGRLGRPLVVEVNGLLEYEVPSGWRRAAVRATHRFTLGRAARVVTVSPLLREALTRRYGFPASRIDVVPNGADLRLFRPRDRDEARRRLGLPPDRTIVFCAASFYRHHGVEILVEAAGRAGALLVLAGGGSGGEGVLSLGPVPHERIPEYVAAADLCACVLRVPHRHFGFSPLKVYEAMAGGRPVAVATDLEELRDFVNRNGVGIAVPPEPGALAEAIRRLAGDPDLRRRLGRRGRELAESAFGWDRAAAQVEESLKKAAGVDPI